MMRCMRRLALGLRREDGTASAEFVIAVPVLLMIFFAAFESGLLMTRYIMLEQSLDMVMRDLRLGNYAAPTAAEMKADICDLTVILVNCEENISIEMTQINTTTWAVPTSQVGCVNRTEDIQPVTMLQIGQQNDVMLMRVCVVQDAMFPTTGIGLGLPLDARGGYGLVTMSAYVTEPS